MPLYREFYGISYVPRTMDIDFAVQLVKGNSAGRMDLQGLFVSQGFTPFFTQSGIQKFSREGAHTRSVLPSQTCYRIKAERRGQESKRSGSVCRHCAKT